jgi:hypothetical protein
LAPATSCRSAHSDVADLPRTASSPTTGRIWRRHAISTGLAPPLTRRWRLLCATYLRCSLFVNHHLLGGIKPLLRRIPSNVVGSTERRRAATGSSRTIGSFCENWVMWTTARPNGVHPSPDFCSPRLPHWSRCAVMSSSTVIVFARMKCSGSANATAVPWGS